MEVAVFIIILLFLMCGGLLLWLYYKTEQAKDLVQRIKEVDVNKLTTWDLLAYRNLNRDDKEDWVFNYSLN